MSDEYVDSNWPAPGIPPVCPDCGEPRGVCRCAEFELPYFWIPNEDDDDDWDDDTYTDQDAESHICPKCNGTGIYGDDITPCDHCDGTGYEWWLP